MGATLFVWVFLTNSLNDPSPPAQQRAPACVVYVNITREIVLSPSPPFNTLLSLWFLDRPSLWLDPEGACPRGRKGFWWEEEFLFSTSWTET